MNVPAIPTAVVPPTVKHERAQPVDVPSHVVAWTVGPNKTVEGKTVTVAIFPVADGCRTESNKPLCL